MNVAVMNIYYCMVLLVSLSTNGEFARGEKDFKSALAPAEMTDRDLTLQQVGNAPERAVSTARAEDPFIRDERGNPLMIKGTEAREEATTKVANKMNHAG